MPGTFKIRAKVFEWRGPAPFHFVAVTGDVAEEIRDVAALDTCVEVDYPHATADKLITVPKRAQRSKGRRS